MTNYIIYKFYSILKLNRLYGKNNIENTVSRLFFINSILRAFSLSVFQKTYKEILLASLMHTYYVDTSRLVSILFPVLKKLRLI